MDAGQLRLMSIAKMLIKLGHLQALLDKFLNRAAHLTPVSTSVVSAVETRRHVLRQRCSIAATVTEDGILA